MVKDGEAVDLGDLEDAEDCFTKREERRTVLRETKWILCLWMSILMMTTWTRILKRRTSSY
jgi:hypothetical protein